MASSIKVAPPPILRIVPIHNVLPHEEHDSQRSEPLIAILKDAEFMTNPPIVAAIENEKYVLLDGANRHYGLVALGYKHILVQVVDYESEYVELDVWNHIVSGWNIENLLAKLQQCDGLIVCEQSREDYIAEIITPENTVYTICAHTRDLQQQNQILRNFTHLYQKNATLYRTSSSNPEEVWSNYPNAIALIRFKPYHPDDIIKAALQKAYLPPGVSRHIIHGRVLKLNYPFAMIDNDSTTLEEKNSELKRWIEQKLARRDIRYYAEATFQFDE